MIEVIILSLLFGVNQKLADSVNEHGTVLFRGANIVFGIIFGTIGAILISINTVFMEFYLGLVLYWLVAGKLDFFNHQLSSALMIIIALTSFNKFNVNVLNLLFVIFAFIILKLGKDWLRHNCSPINSLIDKKIHHLIVAIVFGIWFSNILILISIVFTMVGIMTTIEALKYLNNYIS
jgi:hypothetical protein